MTLNRTSKALIILFAIALIAGLWWRLSSDSNVPARASPAPVTTQTLGAPAARAPLAATGALQPLAIRGPGREADDARCIVKASPPPTVPDAGAEDDPSPASSRVAVLPTVAHDQLLARLQSSRDPYANAVAVWLDIRDDDDATRMAERRRKLAAMAASTRDPRLYSLALRTCWQRTDQECVSLSARRWAELDAGNAMPWVMMLDEAARRQDVAGVQEAMFHITHSERLAELQQAPVQPIVDAASGDAESLVAARSMAVDAIGIAAAQAGPGVFMACKVVTPADANVWQQCTAMVDLLEHRSDSLQARMTGAALDKRLTGNAKPGERVASEMNRLLSLDLAASSGCEDLRAKLAFMRRVAVEGEVAAARGLTR